MEDLKPCPFCGADAYEVPEYHYVMCIKCAVTAVSHDKSEDYSESCKMWNTRPIEDGLRAEIAAKDEQIAKLSESLHHARQLAQSAHEVAELAWGGAIPSPLPRHRRQTEEEFAAEMARLNCPLCGGSGHVDDADQAAVSKIKGLEAEIEQTKRRETVFLQSLFYWGLCPKLPEGKECPSMEYLESIEALGGSPSNPTFCLPCWTRFADSGGSEASNTIVKQFIQEIKTLEAKVQRLEAVARDVQRLHRCWPNPGPEQRDAVIYLAESMRRAGFEPLQAAGDGEA